MASHDDRLRVKVSDFETSLTSEGIHSITPVAQFFKRVCDPSQLTTDDLEAVLFVK
jgi:hypothetical protein